MIKKIIFPKSRFLFLLIGILMAISVSGVWAAWNSTYSSVTSGQPLTSALWNTMTDNLNAVVAKLTDLDERVGLLESRGPGILLGNSASMVLPSGENYKVNISATYFDCTDIATSLLLNGSAVKTYLGFGSDSAGCDQNTIQYTSGSLAGGAYTWSFNRGSQWDFLWQAVRQ